MDLARPAPEIKAKAMDGLGTLLPWAALFVALPLLSVLTCGIKPDDHGGGHGAAAHGGGSGHGAEAGEAERESTTPH